MSLIVYSAAIASVGIQQVVWCSVRVGIPRTQQRIFILAAAAASKGRRKQLGMSLQNRVLYPVSLYSII